MADIPDYSKYSLEDLYAVAQHIDKEKYPDQYGLVAQEIVRKEQKQATEPGVKHAPVSVLAVTIGFFVGGIIGCIVGALFGIAIMWLIVVTAPANTNWDHATGMFGLALLPIPPGGLIGAIIGINRALRRKHFHHES